MKYYISILFVVALMYAGSAAALSLYFLFGYSFVVFFLGGGVAISLFLKFEKEVFQTEI